MSERCPFRDLEGLGCLSPDIIPIAGPCSATGQGDKCGPALALDTAMYKLQGMEAEDALAPITGTFQVLREPKFIELPLTPNALSTIKLKRAFIGLVFPVRQTPAEIVSANGITVNANDLVLSLYGQGRIAHDSDWLEFRTTVERTTERFGYETCVFALDSGQLAPTEDLSSLDFYRRFLPAPVSNQLEDKLFPGYTNNQDIF